MANTSGTYKTGERVTQVGQYRCLDCDLAGTQTIVTLQAGTLFPYCSSCDLKDNTYKLVSGKR